MGRGRHIYNAQTGFLGGGGSAVFLASVVREDEAAQEAYLNESVQSLVGRRTNKCGFGERRRLRYSSIRNLLDSASSHQPRKSCEKHYPFYSGHHLQCNQASSRGIRPEENAVSNVLLLDTTLLDRNLGQRRADVKAWACRQLISIVVSLDREHGECARPMPNPIRSPDSFRFLVSVSSTISIEFLRAFCRDFNSKHGQPLDIGCKAELSVESSDSIRHLLA